MPTARETRLFVEDTHTFEGDPPDDSDRLHADEVEHLIWSFNAVSSLGAHVAFSLRNAVGAFAGRKSKDPITIEDAERLKTAVRAAMRVACTHHETRSLPHLEIGLSAISESTDAWANPTGPQAKPAAFFRSLLIRILKHEVAAADLASLAADFLPSVWLQRQRLSPGEAM